LTLYTELINTTRNGDPDDQGEYHQEEEVPPAAFDLAAAVLHSALCARQFARMQAFPQKYTLRQRLHFLSPALVQLGFAQ
jgi:hypothetical protein